MIATGKKKMNIARRAYKMAQDLFNQIVAWVLPPLYLYMAYMFITDRGDISSGILTTVAAILIFLLFLLHNKFYSWVPEKTLQIARFFIRVMQRTTQNLRRDIGKIAKKA